jgi:iron-sulfur cluster assembly protein
MSQNITICKIDTHTDSIQMTPAAIKHLQKQIEKRGKGIGMRLSLKKSGCSGYAYTMEIIDECSHQDKQFQVHETLILAIPTEDYPFLYGTTIDFVKEGLNSAFKFINPNEKHACGCGESVGF